MGFSLKLALVPLYFWLPAIAENAAPMSVAILVSIVDIAAFSELVQVRQAMPWVFSAHPGIWLAVALFTMFGGALLALGQNHIRRMLAFSTIDDMGYLLLGVIDPTHIKEVRGQAHEHQNTNHHSTQAHIPQRKPGDERNQKEPAAVERQSARNPGLALGAGFQKGTGRNRHQRSQQRGHRGEQANLRVGRTQTDGKSRAKRRRPAQYCRPENLNH